MILIFTTSTHIMGDILDLLHLITNNVDVIDNITVQSIPFNTDLYPITFIVNFSSIPHVTSKPIMYSTKLDLGHLITVMADYSCYISSDVNFVWNYICVAIHYCELNFLSNLGDILDGSTHLSFINYIVSKAYYVKSARVVDSYLISFKI